MAVDMIQGVFRCALLLTLLAVSACGWQRYQAAPLDRQRVPGKAAVASLDDATLGAELTRRGAVGVWGALKRQFRICWRCFLSSQLFTSARGCR